MIIKFHIIPFVYFQYNMVLFDNSRTLCCLLVFFVAFGNTTTVGDNSDAPDHLLGE